MNPIEIIAIVISTVIGCFFIWVFVMWSIESIKERLHKRMFNSPIKKARRRLGELCLEAEKYREEAIQKELEQLRIRL